MPRYGIKLTNFILSARLSTVEGLLIYQHSPTDGCPDTPGIAPQTSTFGRLPDIHLRTAAQISTMEKSLLFVEDGVELSWTDVSEVPINQFTTSSTPAPKHRLVDLDDEAQSRCVN